MTALRLLLLPLLLAGSALDAAESPPAAVPAAPSAAAEQRELSIVVVEMLQNVNSTYSSFDRFDRAFKRLSEKHHWPVKLSAERFDANSPAHATELRIFPKELRQESLHPFAHTDRPRSYRNNLPDHLMQEIPGEVVFLAWLTLTIDGKEHDFGLVKATYDPSPSELRDTVMDKTYDALALEAAKRIEPILFPRPVAPKS